MNDEILQHLHCQFCNQLMKPPVYICEKAHSFCSNCKSTMKDTCLLSNCRISSGRNFLVEEIMELINYPCKNEGCNYVSRLSCLENHEKECKYQLYKCPVSINCTETATYDQLIEHVKVGHLIHQCPTGTFVFDSNTNDYLLHFNTDLFLLQVIFNSRSLQVTLKSIELLNETYDYNVKFSDEKSKTSITFTKQCQMFTNKNQEDGFLIRKSMIKFATKSELEIIKIARGN